MLYSLIGATGLYVLAGWTMPLWSYRQDQAENVIITQLGKPVRADTIPGLGFKVPFYETANRFTKKLVDYHSIPQDALTADKKTIRIDFYAMFRIADPWLFIEKVKPATIDTVQPIIDDLIYSEMRNLMSQEYTLADVLKKGDDIHVRVKGKVAPVLRNTAGIDVIDIRLTMTNPTEAVLGAVYGRMKAERAQKAQQDRSEGQRKKTEIMADADREVVKLNAEAYAKAQKIMGEADANALRTIQDAYSRDPEFAFFLRELSLLAETTGEKDRLIISTDSELYDLMKNIGK